MPGGIDRQQVKEAQERNQASLKGAPNQGTLEYIAAVIDVDNKPQLVVLIGHRHVQSVEKAVAARPGVFRGTVDVGKGGLLGPGELTVRGAKSQFARDFTKVLNEFSKKKVVFK